SILGSDTMVEVLAEWSREFQESYPGISFEIQGTGSAAAPPALAERSVNFGAMSRAMSAREVADFQRRTGHLPFAIQVGGDDLAVIVNPSNPLRSISRRTLDGIFSESQRCGGVRHGHQWSTVLGESEDPTISRAGAWVIQRYSRTAVSGSYGFFKEKVLCGGDLMSQVMELPGFAAIVDAVAGSDGAIAYVGSGFVDERVRVLPVSITGSNSPGGLLPGEIGYPFSRPLFLYLSVAPGQQLSRTECAFLEHVVSPRGQLTLKRQGFQELGLSDSPGISSVCS
ncbi:MAG: substrate-binding domain-containing protein, partial [Pseudohongiellaceae bacterium]